MTNEESDFLIRLMRGSWPDMYLTDDGEVAWKFWLEDKEADDVTRAYRLLVDRTQKPPAIADFVSTIKEVKARKYTCPRCGHGASSEAAVAEHLANVHGEYA